MANKEIEIEIDLDLMDGEEILLEEGEVRGVDKGSVLFFDDLILTNYNLIYVFRSLLGKVKDVNKYALEDILLDENNEAMVYTYGKKEPVDLKVIFKGKKLELLFQDESEENLKIWVNAIRNALYDLTGKGKTIKKDTEAVIKVEPEAVSKEKIKYVSKECFGCKTLITGEEGAVTICEYCGTKQAL